MQMTWCFSESEKSFKEMHHHAKNLKEQKKKKKNHAKDFASSMTVHVQRNLTLFTLN